MIEKLEEYFGRAVMRAYFASILVCLLIWVIGLAVKVWLPA